MISFELSPKAVMMRKMVHQMAAGTFRPLSRKYDSPEGEHKEVEELIPYTTMMKGGVSFGPDKSKKDKSAKKEVTDNGVSMLIGVEEMSWGDAGFMFYLTCKGAGIGQASIQAVATPEQKERFGKKVTAICITEPGCGSDSSAITTSAKLDPKTKEWILNGEKIFVTGGNVCEQYVVWATLDKSKGKAAIRSFIVERERPGLTLTKLENKMGLRASDTAAIVFQDCRIPYDNIMGSATMDEKAEAGFKESRKFFDNTRPAAAAIGLGVGRAAFDMTKDILEKEGYTFPFNPNMHSVTAVQRSVLEMEATLDAMRLLTWRSASMMDTGDPNSVEASMAKAKCGRYATLITHKCVELLGTLGYSQEVLVEKFFRDCKINDIYEGTGQIQMLIIARSILDFDRNMLK